MHGIFRWFVVASALVHLLLGAATVVFARMPTLMASASWPASWATGGFLAFTAVMLFWASFDMRGRAPVIFWEGVLRLWAAFTFTQALDLPMAPVIIASDGAIGLLYIAGLLLVMRLSVREIVGLSVSDVARY